MTIRLIDKTNHLDTAKLYEIYLAAYEVEAQILGVAKIYFFPLQQSIEVIRGSKDEIWGFYLAASLTGAVFLERSNNSITINNLVVDPSSFRQGVAKTLLNHVFYSYPSVEFFVATGAKNLPAINLYERFGFIPISEEVVEPDIKLVKLKKVPAINL